MLFSHFLPLYDTLRQKCPFCQVKNEIFLKIRALLSIFFLWMRIRWKEELNESMIFFLKKIAAASK